MAPNFRSNGLKKNMETIKDARYATVRLPEMEPVEMPVWALISGSIMEKLEHRPMPRNICRKQPAAIYQGLRLSVFIGGSLSFYCL